MKKTFQFVILFLMSVPLFAQSVISSGYGTSIEGSVIIGESIIGNIYGQYSLSQGFLQGEWKIIQSGVDEIVIIPEKWHIFPTLIKDKINVKYHGSEHIGNATIEIYGINGELLLCKSITEGHSIYDMNDMQPGVYISRIINENRVEFYAKLIIQ